MNVSILKKEFPFLKGFLDKKEFIQEMDVRRFGKEILTKNLYEYENSHSWAGSYGVIAFLIFKDGRFEECPYGGWFSDNKRSVKDVLSIPLWRNFLTREGEINQEKLMTIEAIVLNDWDWHNSPGNEYDEYMLFVRPRRKEIRLQLEREIQKELNQLRDLVG